MATERKDVWASGDSYEPYVGRWSRLVARQFVRWIGLPAGSEWLDVGCGTGALSEVVLEATSPSRLIGVDPSDGFVAFVRRKVTGQRARFEVADAQALPFPDGVFDATAAGLVLNFIPSPARAMTEMRRVTRAGGSVAGYVWDYAGDMQMMRRFWDAAVALDRNAVDLDEGRRFPLCRPEPLTALFRDAGLDRVEVKPIDVPTIFKSFEDYWNPFLGGQAPAPGYCMSLSEEHRAALRDRIRQDLPTKADGTIHLMARAWAVRGTRA